MMKKLEILRKIHLIISITKNQITDELDAKGIAGVRSGVMGKIVFLGGIIL